MMKVMSGKIYPGILLIIIASLGACNPLDMKQETIAEVDFNQFRDQLRAAQSDPQIRQLDSLIFDRIEDSSLNRVMPQVWAEDQYGVKVNLALLIDRPSLMVITSPFAQWNSIDLARELPEVAKLIESDKRIICLLLKEPAPKGVEIPQDFYKVQIEQLSALFPNTYLIRKGEAQKLNIFTLPSRYYFDDKGVLQQISPTAVSFNQLKAEVKRHFK